MIEKRSKKGITLIALVITIVVMLILAGVSINALVGDNGIITNSVDAKAKTRNCTVRRIFTKCIR